MSPSIAADDIHVNVSAEPKVTSKVAEPAIEQLVLNTIRCLAGDLCQQFGGGHPGTVMGAAPIALALWRYAMRYNPRNPNWFGRDRFVLSAGHACLLQYIQLHFSGYEAWTMDQLKSYHSKKTSGNMAAGHPEIEYPGIEVTTGPLGQGIANAVGMAMAGKQLGALYNKEGLEIIGQKVWCFTGDGCIQEGVGQEALSMAGHLGLDNLILIYDNNSVIVDGRIDNCFTDDTSAKLKATGWHVIDVDDGSNDVAAIVAALEQAKGMKGKPVFLNIRTVIGFSSRKANTGPAHGQALGVDEVAYVKQQLNFDPTAHFHVPQKVYEYYGPKVEEGKKLEREWNEKMERYKKEYPNEEKELRLRMSGRWHEDESGLPAMLPPKSELPTEAQPTRKSSGIVVQKLVPSHNSFIAGSADLLESTFVNFEGQHEFQNPASGLGDYSGRQVRYGIREFSMVAIGNGLAAYHKGMFIPIMSTFFMFWLYAAPAARMSALMGLRFIGIATHDSIGIGEDGPTHQPVALAAFYRALPNFNLIRPADAEEVIGAWLVALGEANTPSLFALSRQAVPLLEGSDRSKVASGAYTIYKEEVDQPDIVLVSTGAEVYRSVEVARLLEELGRRVRVVSMPSQRHFDLQSEEYRHSVLPSTSLVIAIEAWSSYGWAKYADASLSMHTFGHSAPNAQLYEYFGFNKDNLAGKIQEFYQEMQGKPKGRGVFRELLVGHTGH